MRALVTVQPDGRVSGVEETPDDWGAFLRERARLEARRDQLEREAHARERAREVRDLVALAFRGLTWLSTRSEV